MNLLSGFRQSDQQWKVFQDGYEGLDLAGMAVSLLPKPPFPSLRRLRQRPGNLLVESDQHSDRRSLDSPAAYRAAVRRPLACQAS